MSNSFDFELTAGDKASATIIRIDEAIRKLNPQIAQTREGLKFGGQASNDSLDGLTGRLTNMSRAARENVQFIGDMVPPLKMVGEISEKFSKFAQLGVIAAPVAAMAGVAYAAGKLAVGYRDAARSAYDLDVHSKNAGMRVDDFTRLTGAMRILGADSESASASVEGLFKTFNDAAAGNNSGVLAVMSQIGAEIYKTRDGSVDVLRTMEELARVFPRLRPEMQKVVSDALGFTPEDLRLLREGAHYKELLAKSDKIGLTVDPGFNQQMVQFNQAVNEASASWDGFKARIERKVFSTFNQNGATDAVNGITDMLDNGFDNISIGHFNGSNKGDDATLMRRAQKDPEFLKTLDSNEQNQLTAGVMTDKAREKYHQYFYNRDRVQQLQGDLSVITRPPVISGGEQIPYEQPRNNARGMRNHNPGNLRSAPNAVGRDTGPNGSFSVFGSDKDGLAAQARQLMLYGDRGNNTLNGIIHTYAPATENKTQAYIDDVSRQTGYKPGDRLNLHDPETLRRLMAAMITHENGTQPFSREQIGAGINDAIFDDRWRGLRDANVLARQRGGRVAPEIDQGEGSPNQQSDTAGDVNFNDRASTNIFSQPQPDISGIPQAIKTAFEENPLKLDVTFTNGQTGERQTHSVNNGGRVVYPMQTR